MILKDMMKFCKKTKTIRVEYDSKNKYLSNGDMFAYIGDCPSYWHSRDCAAAGDIDDEMLESFEIYDDEPTDNIRYEVANLEQVEKLTYSVDCLQPFILPDNKIFFIDIKKLDVFKDVHLKRYFFGKYNGVEALYIVTNTLVVGAIRANKVNLSIMEEFGQKLNFGIKTSSAHNFLDAGGQMVITDM